MQDIPDILRYKEALSYLDSFSNYEKVRNYSYNEKYFDLKRVLKISSFLGNPHQKFRTVHIAGTKGKGSTATICANILARCGYKVGLYTSPHLIDFRERIKILDAKSERMISKEEVIRLTSEIKNAVDKLFPPSPFTSDLSPLPPTTFELYTILAFIYFARQKIEIGVIEVGMGGRLDATNIVRGDVCIITTIGYDHTKDLGTTLSQIAQEKCGIIKEGTVVISSPQRRAAELTIKKICRERHCKLYLVGNEIKFNPILNTGQKSKKWTEKFELNGIFKKYKNLELLLLGKHQIINAASAIWGAELLQNKEIKQNILRCTLRELCIPGRIQIIGKNPTIILDGAHNPESAEALIETISGLVYNRVVFIISIFADKDIKSFIRVIMKIAEKIIITKISYARTAEPSSMLKLFPKYDNIIVKDNLEKALGYAKGIANKDDLICITGSMYLVGEVLKKLRVTSYELNPQVK